MNYLVEIITARQGWVKRSVIDYGWVPVVNWYTASTQALAGLEED